jgi:hypothetical protein
MPARPSLRHHLTLRLLIALPLFAVLIVVLGAWIYRAADAQAAAAQLARGHEHYTSVIADLQRRWGREAFNLKIRLEAQGFLEKAGRQPEKLLSHLISQGSSIEFPSLHVESSRGELIAAYEYTGDVIPKARFLPGQESTWAFDPEHGHLFLVFRQMIWLGKENGYLVLFKPMDHALLSAHSYPSARLTLWWQGKPVASSEGEDGLASAAAKKTAGTTGDAVEVSLPWSNSDPDNAPQLELEITPTPLLSWHQLAVPLAIGLLAFAVGGWLLLGSWANRTLRRIQMLERAQSGFIAQHKVDAKVDHDLHAGHAGEEDEIAALAVGMERLMREVPIAVSSPGSGSPASKRGE